MCHPHPLTTPNLNVPCKRASLDQVSGYRHSPSLSFSALQSCLQFLLPSLQAYSKYLIESSISAKRFMIQRFTKVLYAFLSIQKHLSLQAVYAGLTFLVLKLLNIMLTAHQLSMMHVNFTMIYQTFYLNY